MRIFLISLVVTSFASCTYDKEVDLISPITEEITFSIDILPIMQAKCATSGCHNGSDRPEDFTNYLGLSPYLINSSFESRVLDIGDMPPSGGLTSDEKTKIRFWLDNDAQNN